MAHTFSRLGQALMDGLWQLKRTWELLKFERRRKGYRNKNYPIRWRTAGSLVAEDLEYASVEDGPQAVDDAFIARLLDGRKEAQERIRRNATFSGAATLYLLLGSLSIDLPLSIGGFTMARVPGLNELLVVGLAGALATTLAPFLNTIVLGHAIKAAVNIRYTPATRYFHRSAVAVEDPPVFFSPHYVPTLFWTRFVKYANWLSSGYLIALVIGLFGFLVASRYLIYSYVLGNPSVPPPWGAVICWISVIIDVATVLYVALYLVPLPYRDYALNLELAGLESLNPDRAAARRKEAFGDEVQDQMRMEELGYMKPPPPLGDK